MALFITTTYNLKKPQFTSTVAAGTTLVTSVPVGAVGVFIGPAVNVHGHGRIVTSLEDCAHALREAGMPAPAATAQRALASKIPDTGATTTVALDATTLADTHVGVAYGEDFVGIPGQSLYVQAAVKRLIEWWQETVAKAA